MELGSRPYAILHGRPTDDLVGTRPFGDSHSHGQSARDWQAYYTLKVLATQDPCDETQPPSIVKADPLEDPCDSWAFIPKD